MGVAEHRPNWEGAPAWGRTPPGARLSAVTRRGVHEIHGQVHGYTGCLDRRPRVAEPILRPCLDVLAFAARPRGPAPARVVRARSRDVAVAGAARSLGGPARLHRRALRGRARGSRGAARPRPG